MNFPATIVLALAASSSLLAAEPNSTHAVTAIPPYRDDWKLVEVKPRESKEVWLFRKNLGVSEIKGHKGLPILVYFTVQFSPYDETGLPSKDDAKVLYDFEEAVIPKVEKEAGCILVGSVIKGGVKDHLFYVSNADSFAESLNHHRQALQGFKVSLEKHDDPKWEAYEDFPDGK